jgi:hypothetical protein
MVLSVTKTYTAPMRNLGLRSAVIVSIGLWLITVASRFAFNGLVFGFDYGLFHPDGSLYAFKTLTLMGLSQEEAGIKVAAWYSEHAYKLNSIAPESLYFENNTQWIIYGTRLAYPILSIPFVALIGMNGLLVVPAVSLLILFIGIVLLGHHYKKVNLCLLLIFVFSVSTTVGRWMLINSTDSLLVAATTILTYLCVKSLRDRYWIPTVIAVIILGSMTRFSLLLWIGFAIVFYLNKQWLRGSVVSFVALACFIPTLFLDFQSAVLPNEGDSSLLAKTLKLPVSMMRMAFYDVAQLAVLDRTLLVTLACGIFVAIRSFKSMSSRFFLCCLLMLWCTSGLNGTPGVNFRYELPILPLLAWVLIDNRKAANRLNDAGIQT